MSETKCINVKVQYIRPKYNNLYEWMQDPQNVYIARKGVVFINGQRYPPKSSEFCNPFQIGKDGTREEVIAKYKEYIEQKLHDEPEFKTKLMQLKGKTLGCWCVPERCHGEVLCNLLEKNKE